MLIEALLRNIEDRLIVEEADVMFDEALSLFEDVEATHHFNERLQDRLQNLSKLELPEAIMSKIPQQDRQGVLTNALAQVKMEIANRLKIVERTQYDPTDDRNIAIIMKIAVVQVSYQGRTFPAWMEAQYNNKSRTNEGVGDMFYCILYNEKAITFILGNSQKSDKQLVAEALSEKNRYNPPPNGAIVVGLNKTRPNLSDLIITVNLDEAVKKQKITSALNSTPTDRPDVDRETIYKIARTKKLDIGVTMNVPKKGRGIIRNIKWYNNDRADLFMEFAKSGKLEKIKVVRKD